jgi:Arc/MetJ-type ribon-helix-helix transcriptional regulator
MKTLTVRLPESIVAEIDAESRRRKLSKSDIVRERLQAGPPASKRRATALDGIADLIGSVDGLAEGLSARRREHLLSTGYGRKRPR